jgi:ABC-type transport system involved in multi-copper enzyme maturation permease subunit
VTRILTVAAIVWLEVVRRKDAYVLLILLGALLAMLVSLDIFGLGGITRYTLDIGLLGAWLFGWILAILVSARQLPQEESRGTVFSLLAKPVTRLQALTGKLLGAWAAVCAATLAFYALVWAVVAAKGGHAAPLAMVQGYLLHAAALALICATALALSTRMHADAAASLAFVFTGAAILLVPRVPEFLARETSPLSATCLLILYNLLPHFDILDLRRRMVYDWGPAPWPAFALAALYAAVWVCLLLLLGWLAYRRKAFTRSRAYGA